MEPKITGMKFKRKGGTKVRSQREKCRDRMTENCVRGMKRKYM